MAKDDAVKVLNDLIETSENGEKGFTEAANITDDNSLRMLFRQYAEECHGAVVELQDLVSALGGTPKHSGTAGAAVHRGWTKVKSMVENKNIAVLEEIERAEDYAKTAYGEALQADLPRQISATILKQQEGVLRHHDRVRQLRDAYRSGSMGASA